MAGALPFRKDGRGQALGQRIRNRSPRSIACRSLGEVQAQPLQNLGRGDRGQDEAHHTTHHAGAALSDQRRDALRGPHHQVGNADDQEGDQGRRRLVEDRVA